MDDSERRACRDQVRHLQQLLGSSTKTHRKVRTATLAPGAVARGKEGLAARNANAERSQPGGCYLVITGVGRGRIDG